MQEWVRRRWSQQVRNRRPGIVHVPFVDLKSQTRELHDELHEAFESVSSRAAYTLGPELAEFERRNGLGPETAATTTTTAPPAAASRIEHMALNEEPEFQDIFAEEMRFPGSA